MRLNFWTKTTRRVPDDIRAWNAMVAFTDPEWCWQAISVVDTRLPGNALNCEMAFLMGSIVRESIRTTFDADSREAAIASAEAAYFKTFDDQSDEELPAEMKAVYGNTTIGKVARVALAQYGEHSDQLFLTSSVFVARLRTDPRVKYEVMPILENCRRLVLAALKK